MQPGRAIRLVFALFFVACLGAGCGDSGKESTSEPGKEVGVSPVMPGLSKKAAASKVRRMPHL